MDNKPNTQGLSNGRWGRHWLRLISFLIIVSLRFFLVISLSQFLIDGMVHLSQQTSDERIRVLVTVIIRPHKKRFSSLVLINYYFEKCCFCNQFYVADWICFILEGNGFIIIILWSGIPPEERCKNVWNVSRCSQMTRRSLL